MRDRAGLGRAERAAQRLAAWLRPRRGRLADRAERSPLALQPALLVLGGGQRAIDAPVVLEQLVAAVQTDQAALRNAVDLFADLDDLVFQLADALAGLELGQALLQHVRGRARRAADPRG